MNAICGPLLALISLCICCPSQSASITPNAIMEGDIDSMLGEDEALLLRRLQSFEAAKRLLERRGTEEKRGKLVRFEAANGARNCYFTPIQCMLQQDIAKFRKLAGER